MTQKFNFITELFGMLGSNKGSPKYHLIPSEEDKLFRVQALQSFSDVKAGEIGGLVSGEKNLSHNGTCWVYDDARVTGKAKVTGSAQIRDNAQVEENARVTAFARVKDNAHIGGNSLVEHCATVSGHARVEDKAKLGGYINIGGDARIGGDTRIGYKKHSIGYNMANNNHPEMIIHGDFLDRKRIDWPTLTR